MTNRRPRLLLLAGLAVFSALGLWLHDCLAEGLPSGVVAVIGKEDKAKGLTSLTLTFDGLCLAAVQHAEPDLRRLRGGPRNILEQLIEEEMIQQECKRLGIVVTQQDVNAMWQEWDTRVRRLSNGIKNLKDMIRENGQTQAEFVQKIWHQLRKTRVAEHAEWLGRTLPKGPDHENERLNQVNIVVGQLRDKTTVKYGVWLVDHAEAGTRPDTLPRGVVATVNTAPITTRQFGRALVLRLPGHKVRDYLENECKTALIRQGGIGLTDADLDAELAYLEGLWPLERELLRERLFRTVLFKDRFMSFYGINMEDVKRSRYHKGLLALVGHERSQVQDKDIVAEFEANKAGRYGPHIVVDDIVISFAQKRGLMSDVGLRTRKKALEIAQGIVSQHANGVSFEKIVSGINSAQNETLRAHQIRLYKTDADRILYGEAARLRDGDVSPPFDTLSEVHVIRRIGARPARSLQEVKPYVRELIARQNAKTWLKERISDPAYVQLQWPLRERTDEPARPGPRK